MTRMSGQVTLPGAFVGALLGGSSPYAAAKFQIVVLVGLLCAESLTAVLIAYQLGARLSCQPIPRRCAETSSESAHEAHRVRVTVWLAVVDADAFSGWW